jgi:hypothetical protein
MLRNLARTFGMENEMVIFFGKMAEDVEVEDAFIERLYYCIMSMKYK